MSGPANYALELWRGDTFLLEFTYKTGPTEATVVATSVAGMTFRFKARKASDESTVILGGSSDDGIITLNADGMTGKVRVEFPYATTAALPLGSHRYDIDYLDLDGRRKTLLYGQLAIVEDETV